MSIMQVVALIHEGNGEFAATFPDFPGVIVAAPSTDAVIAEATRVLAAEVDAMIEDGLEMPTVRALSELADDPTFAEDSAGAMVALVPCPISADMVRVAIALDRALLAALERAAEAAGKTRSTYVAEAVRRRLAAADDHGEAAPGHAGAETGTPSGGSPADVRVLMESIRRSLAVIDQTPAAEPGSEDAAKHWRG
jgi:predicted RNase H-like HicB family nuclease